MTGATAGATAGREEEDKGVPEIKMRSFPNTQGAMSNGEPEVEVVKDKP